MQNGIVHLRSNRRKPVRCVPPLYARDIQQDVPAGWCTACGQELYAPDLALCRRCERMEHSDEETNEPLSDLYTGEKSR